MIRLVGVELTRLRLRRAVLVLLLAAVVVPGLVTASMIWDGRPVGEADRAQAAALAAEALAEAERSVDACVERPAEWGVPEGGDEADLRRACYDAAVGSPDYYTTDAFLHRAPLDLAQERDDTGLAVVVLLTLVMLLVGATYAGADWSSGSMSVQLLTEPRRSRVWAAKAVAVGSVAAVASTLVLLACWGALALFASLWDDPTTPAQWERIVTSAACGVVLATGAALATYGLTMLLRSTVGTLGAVLALTLGSALLANLLPVAAPERWNVPTNALAFLLGRVEYFDPTLACGPGASCTAALERPAAALYLGVGLVLALVASWVSFRRRDVP